MQEKLSARGKLLFAAVALSAAMTATSLAGPTGLRRLTRLRADIERQKEKNRELRVENARLLKTVHDLSAPSRTDALEKAAREQLGFVRQDEVLFKFE